MQLQLELIASKEAETPIHEPT